MLYLAAGCLYLIAECFQFSDALPLVTELLEDGVMGEGSVEGEEDEGDEVDEGNEWGVGSSSKQDCYDGKKSLHIASLCVAYF